MSGPRSNSRKPAQIKKHRGMKRITRMLESDVGKRMMWRPSTEPVHIKKPGRNDPCPCMSGKKYKKCCGKDT